MKKTLIFLILFIFAGLLVAQDKNFISDNRFEKWQNPSFFRGYNVLYESPKSQQDFIDFKNYGGNLFHIQPDAFYAIDAPYGLVQANIDGCDMLVNFCRGAGIHYVIGMRSGPGAYDTFDESQGTVPESRIWNTGNTVEQQKYAEMLQMIVQRYAGDTLFVGINLVIEPRPKVRSIPANNSATYKFFLESIFNIHMDQIYTGWVAAIRQVDAGIPVIIESFGYSTAELFPGYVINDPYIVYSAHNYQPVQYTKEAAPLTVTYPGVYWNITHLAQVLFDGPFMRETVFGKLREFQQTTGAPVFIGEFGMYKPQIGGEQYLQDVLDICTDYGWHFAFWDWRRGPGADWNIEKFGDPGDAHWKTVLSKFYAPPVPKLQLPLEGENVTLLPSFTWDSLTAFTTYDIKFEMVEGSRENTFMFTDITSARYTFTEASLVPGIRYSWSVRSKNPGGNPENSSEWSEKRTFRVSGSTDKPGRIITEDNRFELKQNSPNPFNPSTVINFNLSKSSTVKLTVYDLLGREVVKLVDGSLQSGVHSSLFNANGLPSGVYIYRLEANPADGTTGITEVKRMILIK